MLRDETNHAQPLAAIFGRLLGNENLEEKGGLCEGANPFAVAIETCTCLKASHTDSSETRCRFNVVWTLSGGRGCISLADLSS